MGCNQSNTTKNQPTGGSSRREPINDEASLALDSIGGSDDDDDVTNTTTITTTNTTITTENTTTEYDNSNVSTLKTSTSPLVSYQGSNAGSKNSSPSKRPAAIAYAGATPGSPGPSVQAGGGEAGPLSDQKSSSSSLEEVSSSNSSVSDASCISLTAAGVVAAKAPPTHEYTCLPQLIGKGGTATVYLGAMKELGKEGAKAVPVAVKSVDIGDAKQLAIIESEYETLERMNECPQIVRVHHFEHLQEKKKGRIYMELCRKGSLRAVVKKCIPQQRMHELFIRAYMRDALKGLVFLHQRGIIHRDFKPENMLVWNRYEPPADNEAFIPFFTTAACAGAGAGAGTAAAQEPLLKLTDFGTSKYTLHGICATTVNVVGTVPYMSPECIKGKFTEASDIWAFGISFLELATTGQMVWSHLKCKDSYGLLLKIGMLQPPNHHPPICGHLSTAARALLARCFATAWAERPSAQELLDDEYFALSDAELMALADVESAEAYASAT